MERHGKTSRLKKILMNVLGQEGRQAANFSDRPLSRAGHEIEEELSGLTALSRRMELILDTADRTLADDPEGSGVSWAHIARVLGSLAARIIDGMERVHGMLVASSARRAAPAIPEASLIRERLRAGRTFALPEKRIAFFGEASIKAFGDNRITAFGARATRPASFTSGGVNLYAR